MIDSESLGTDSIEVAIKLLVKNAKLGVKIAEGGVDASDVKYAAEAFANIQEIIAFIGSKPEIVEQFKDIDISEGILLLQKIYEGYKEVVA